MNAKRHAILFLIFLAILLIWRWSIAQDSSRRISKRYLEPAEKNPFPFEFQVAALRDSEYMDAVISLINSAQRTIDVSMFMAQEPKGSSALLLTALMNASRRGVRIRALFEDCVTDNFIWVSAINNCGGDAHLDDQNTKLHDKAIMIDGSLLIMGSHNWSNAALDKNKELSLILKSKPSAFIEWSKRFDVLFLQAQPFKIDTTIPEIIVPIAMTVDNNQLSKIHYISCRGRIVMDGDYFDAFNTLVLASAHSINAGMYYVSPRAIGKGNLLDPIMTHIQSKIDSGMLMTVIMDQMNINQEGEAFHENQESMRVLLRMGINSSFDRSDQTHHVKCVVGDSEVFLTGSHNWTVASIRFNKEVSFLGKSHEMGTVLTRYLKTLENLTPIAQSDTTRKCRVEDLITIH